MLLLTVPAVTAGAQEMHTGAIPNSGNDMYLVQGDAENPLGLSADYGSVVVRETLSFANTDPNLTTDYGIVFISPVFEWDDLYPRVTSFTWDYDVANYTLQLINATDLSVVNFTGLTNDSFVIDPSQLNPDGPDQPDPKVNTTYYWNVSVIDTRGQEIMSLLGGIVTTSHNQGTVFDLGTLELPPLGPSHFKASSLQLIDLTMKLVFEPHPTLTTGFYRVYVSDTMFHYGVSFTVVVQYRGEMRNDKVVIDKLIFQTRPIQIDVYLEDGMEVKVFDTMGGTGTQISPDHLSDGPGDPTSYQVTATHSVVVQEEGADGTDWGMVGRYAALIGVMVLLIVVVMWGGPKGRDDDGEDVDGDEGDYAEEGPEGASEGKDGGKGEEAPLKPPEGKGRPRKGTNLERRREELEARKASLIGEIKSVDTRHDDGALPDREWRLTRAALMERAVKVVKQLEELEEREERQEQEEREEREDD
jgi:hypothetical protein